MMENKRKLDERGERGGPVTRNLQEELECTCHSRKFAVHCLPTRRDVLLHERFLIDQGKFKMKDPYAFRARLLTTAIRKVWEDCGVTPKEFRSVLDKTKKLLIAKSNWDNSQMGRLAGSPLVPDEGHLFDISSCKCFPDGTDMSGFTLEGCTCNPRIWDEKSLDFYGDQRTTRKKTMPVMEPMPEEEEGDAEEAHREDIAMTRTELQDMEDPSEF